MKSLTDDKVKGHYSFIVTTEASDGDIGQRVKNIIERKNPLPMQPPKGYEYFAGIDA